MESSPRSLNDLQTRLAELQAKRDLWKQKAHAIDSQKGNALSFERSEPQSQTKKPIHPQSPMICISLDENYDEDEYQGGNAFALAPQNTDKDDLGENSASDKSSVCNNVSFEEWEIQISANDRDERDERSETNEEGNEKNEGDEGDERDGDVGGGEEEHQIISNVSLSDSKKNNSAVEDELGPNGLNQHKQGAEFSYQAQLSMEEMLAIAMRGPNAHVANNSDYEYDTEDDEERDIDQDGYQDEHDTSFDNDVPERSHGRYNLLHRHKISNQFASHQFTKECEHFEEKIDNELNGQSSFYGEWSQVGDEDCFDGSVYGHQDKPRIEFYNVQHISDYESVQDGQESTEEFNESGDDYNDEEGEEIEQTRHLAQITHPISPISVFGRTRNEYTDQRHDNHLLLKEKEQSTPVQLNGEIFCKDATENVPLLSLDQEGTVDGVTIQSIEENKIQRVCGNINEKNQLETCDEDQIQKDHHNHNLEGAIQILQASWRGNSQRKSFLLQKSASIQIQRFWRQYYYSLNGQSTHRHSSKQLTDLPNAFGSPRVSAALSESNHDLQSIEKNMANDNNKPIGDIGLLESDLKPISDDQGSSPIIATQIQVCDRPKRPPPAPPSPGLSPSQPSSLPQLNNAQCGDTSIPLKPQTPSRNQRLSDFQLSPPQSPFESSLFKSRIKQTQRSPTSNSNPKLQLCFDSINEDPPETVEEHQSASLEVAERPKTSENYLLESENRVKSETSLDRQATSFALSANSDKRKTARKRLAQLNSTGKVKQLVGVVKDERITTTEGCHGALKSTQPKEKNAFTQKLDVKPRIDSLKTLRERAKIKSKLDKMEDGNQPQSNEDLETLIDGSSKAQIKRVEEVQNASEEQSTKPFSQNLANRLSLLNQRKVVKPSKLDWSHVHPKTVSKIEPHFLTRGRTKQAQTVQKLDYSHVKSRVESGKNSKALKTSSVSPSPSPSLSPSPPSVSSRSRSPVTKNKGQKIPSGAKRGRQTKEVKEESKTASHPYDLNLANHEHAISTLMSRKEHAKFAVQPAALETPQRQICSVQRQTNTQSTPNASKYIPHTRLSVDDLERVFHQTLARLPITLDPHIQANGVDRDAGNAAGLGFGRIPIASGFDTMFVDDSTSVVPQLCSSSALFRGFTDRSYIQRLRALRLQEQRWVDEAHRGDHRLNFSATSHVYYSS